MVACFSVLGPELVNVLPRRNFMLSVGAQLRSGRGGPQLSHIRGCRKSLQRPSATGRDNRERHHSSGARGAEL
jgi:hypothetical protein